MPREDYSPVTGNHKININIFYQGHAMFLIGLVVCSALAISIFRLAWSGFLRIVFFGYSITFNPFYL